MDVPLGEEGFKKSGKTGDVICGRPLSRVFSHSLATTRGRPHMTSPYSWGSSINGEEREVEWKYSEKTIVDVSYGQPP